MPPEDVAPLMEQTAVALLASREVYDRLWNEQRMQNHQDNLSNMHGWYKGTYYHNGVAQPRG